VSALCAASDAVILPSRFETFGLVVLETLASESPQLGERSRDHVARNFTLPGMGDVLNDTLEQALRGGFGA
jgi:hypothetical protein